MLVAKIIICILTLIALFIARIMYEEDNRTLASDIVAVIAGILGIIFFILIITTRLNLFIIPKMLLFISICLYILFKEELEFCAPFWIGMAITVIAFVITGVMYINNIEVSEVPEVERTSCTIMCAKDNSSITGNMSGSIFYVLGSVSEESVYKYYYQLKDGGIKQGTIPADSTTIYFVKDGEEPHLETIITTTYTMNYNDKPATVWNKESKTTYKLYVPEGSIHNVYEFNAE